MSERVLRAFNSELDRKVGVIKTPALCLIEGPNDSGKSSSYFSTATAPLCRVTAATLSPQSPACVV
jgi:hypothetical protein